MKKPRNMVGAAATTTVARPEFSSSRCWGDLPKDIIDSILERLLHLADYDRFGAVCSRWRHASLDPINRNRRIESSLSSSSPLLLLAPGDDNGKSPEEKPWKFTLFDVVRGNTIVKELTSPPIPDSGKLFYGSIHGWLIFADRNRSLTLINPFYTGGGGGGGMIRLPRLPNHNHIGKVVLSADPSLSPNDYTVFVIYVAGNKVVFIKSGDNDWSWIKRRDFYSSHFYVNDLVFHKGLVYAVDEGNVFYVCDIFKERVQWFDLLCVAPPTPGGRARWRYIVQSPDDDELILVYRSAIGDLHDFQTRQFCVYKLLLTPGGPATWLEMKNLGSDSKAIILGRNHSVCIKSSHGGFQPNSIYFLNDNFCHGPWRFTNPTIQEVGIFNMDDGSITKCYQRGDLAEGVEISPPAWFFPSLPGNWKKVS